MESDANSARQPERKPPLAGLATVVFIAIFLILTLLLGRAMVEHRFFKGERVHSNGSIGQ